MSSADLDRRNGEACSEGPGGDPAPGEAAAVDGGDAESDSESAAVVAEVLRPGYRWRRGLLRRPAGVAVRGGRG